MNELVLFVMFAFLHPKTGSMAVKLSTVAVIVHRQWPPVMGNVRVVHSTVLLTALHCSAVHCSALHWTQHPTLEKPCGRVKESKQSAI